MEMEVVLNVVYAVVMIQLRMWIMPHVRAVAEDILVSFVVPMLAYILVIWCNAKILESVNMKDPNGDLNNFLKDTRGFALIAGPIEESYVKQLHLKYVVSALM
jgi:hypothetical protein